jgi:hypothetical protein
MKLTLLGENAKGRCLAADSTECINLYLEKNSTAGKSQYTLYGTPGKKLFVDCVGDKCRGLFTSSKERLFAVVGKTLYEIDILGTATSRGTINTTNSDICFAENEFQLMFVDGIEGWVFTYATNALTQITSDEYFSGTHVINKDGYFIQNKINTNEFYFSSYQDGTVWDASDYYTAEGSGDNINAVGKVNNEAWIFGQNSVEVWYATGDATNPFTRTNQGSSDVGLAAPRSVASNTNSIFWLGAGAQGHGIVWMASSYQPTRISTHAIEYTIGQISDITDARGYCYQNEGHFFYVLNFTIGNKTLVYDMTTGLWHERGILNLNTGLNDGHDGIAHAYFNNKNYVGTGNDGKIWELSMDTYTDNNSTIKRVFTFPHIAQENKYITFNSLEIEVERGQGLDGALTTQGNNPKMMLRFSDDGGFTWTGYKTANMGKMGQYKTRVAWDRLGTSRDRVFQISVTDPIKVCLIDAYADIEIERG